ncbi:hypothetical protein GPN2_13031 [Streptomyces murinus]
MHGLLTDSLASYYFTVAPAFAAAGLDVLMYDLRGHGRSERPARGYTLDHNIDDLTALLDRLGVTGPVHLVGNSYGGTVAFGYAARDPERVATLTLVESEPATPAWASKLGGILHRVVTQLAHNERDAIAWITANRGHNTARLAKGAARLARETSLGRDIPASRVHTEAEIGAVRCPVLGVYGGDSDLADLIPLHEARLPDFRSVVLPGHEHSVLVEAPGAVGGHILDLIRAARAPSGERLPVRRTAADRAHQPGRRGRRPARRARPPGGLGLRRPGPGAPARGPRRPGVRLRGPGAGRRRRRTTPELRGAEALKFLWEWYLLPLADAMAPGVRAAVEEFRPDVVVADQQAFAGALVAERLGLPWATSATTSAEFSGAYDGLPKVAEWLRRRLAELRERLGDPSGTADPRSSPHLLLIFSSPELVGPQAPSAPHIHYVGPSLAGRPHRPGFPWEWLTPGRAKVLVTLGTANADAGARFLAACREALRERADRVQAVLVDPGGVLPAQDGGKDLLVLPSVPQLALLERMDVVICHAGHNTVCEALWHGVPLVTALSATISR